MHQTGKVVGTFAHGTRKVYDFINDNPAVGKYSFFSFLSVAKRNLCACTKFKKWSNNVNENA